MDINNESLQDIGAKEGAKAIQAKALGLPQMAQKHSELSKKAFTEFRKGREEKEEKEASKTEKGEAATKLRSIRAKIREHLDTYNISEECKQSILELFDRPSLGRHVYNAVGGSNVTKAIKDKIQDWKNKADQPGASKAYDTAHKAHQEVQARYNNGQATPSELAQASGEFKKASDRFNKAYGYSGHTTPGAPKPEVQPASSTSSPKGPTKKEQIRSYLNTKKEHQNLASNTKKAAGNYDFKHYDYQAVKDSDYGTPSEVAKYQHDASQAKSKFIKAKTEEGAKKSEIVNDRRKLFPKSPKISGRLPKYVRGTGKYKEIKESLEASLIELNSLFENINTAIGGMMDVQPINLAGKPHPSCKQKKAQLNYKYKKLRRKEV